MCAVKSIINVQVNSAEFEKFYNKFEEYQKHLEAMPDNWSEVGAAGKKTTAAFAALFGEMASVADSSNEIVKALNLASKAQKEFHKSTTASGDSMKKLVKDAEKLSKEIFGIGKALTKMGVIGFGAASAGIYGLNRLGQSAVSNQRSARGIGLTQGEIKAFNLDFGRYINESALGNMASAQSDYSKMARLAQATGMSISEVQSAGADILAIRSAEKLRSWYNSGGPKTAQTLSAAGFGEIGYSMEDARRIGAMSDAELAQAKGAYGKDKNSLSINDSAVDKWYELTRAMGRAGETIETALTNKLDVLGPLLGDLTTNLADRLSTWIKDLPEADIKAFTDGVKEVANYISKGELLKNIEDFGVAVGDVTHFVAHSLDILPDWMKPAKQQSEQQSEQQSAFNILHRDTFKSYPLDDLSKMEISNLKAIEKANGWEPGSLVGIFGAESSFGQNAGKNPNSSAEGPFQQTTAFRKDMNVLNTSYAEEVKGLEKFFKTRLPKYGGDFEKTLAAYKEGEGQLDADLRKAAAVGDSANWKKYLSDPEMKQYMQNYQEAKKVGVDLSDNKFWNTAATGLSAPTGAIGIPKINLTVDNRTGNDISISANAAAATH